MEPGGRDGGVGRGAAVGERPEFDEGCVGCG